MIAKRRLENLLYGAVITVLPLTFQGVTAKAEESPRELLSQEENKRIVDVIVTEIDRLYSQINQHLEYLSEKPPSSLNDERIGKLEFLVYHIERLSRIHLREIDADDYENKLKLDPSRINADQFKKLVELILQNCDIDELKTSHKDFLYDANKYFGIKPDNLAQMVMDKLLSNNTSDFEGGVRLTEFYELKLPELTPEQKGKVEANIHTAIGQGGHSDHHYRDIFYEAGLKITLEKLFLDYAEHENYVNAFIKHIKSYDLNTIMPLHLNEEQTNEFEEDIRAYFRTHNYGEAFFAIWVAHEMGNNISSSIFKQKDISYLRMMAKNIGDGIAKGESLYKYETSGRILEYTKKLYPDIYKEFGVNPEIEKWMDKNDFGKDLGRFHNY